MEIINYWMRLLTVGISANASLVHAQNQKDEDNTDHPSPHLWALLDNCLLRGIGAIIIPTAYYTIRKHIDQGSSSSHIGMILIGPCIRSGW